MTMQSWQVTEWGRPLQLRLRDMPVPEGEALLVRVEAAGVCHSDVHIGKGYFDMGGGDRVTLEQTGAQLPLTMGHEIAGTVVARGPNASGPAVGTRVVVYPWVGCGRCAHCVEGRDADCERPRSLGVRANGGFSSHVLVPKGRFLLPTGGVDTARAATFACSGLTAYGALKKLPAMTGDDRLVILGAGGLGMAAIALAPLLSAAGIVAADIDEAKLTAAVQQGALIGFNTTAADAATALKAAAGGPIRGVIDFVGTPQTAELALAVAVKGATVVIVGMAGGKLALPLPLLPMRNLTLRGSYVGSLDELAELLRLAESGRLKPTPLATRPMAEINQVIDDLEHHRIVGRMVALP